MLTSEELASVPLFSCLPAEDLARVASHAADIQLATGEYAVHEGEERALYAVVSGRIEVTKSFDGIERTIGWRAAGKIFGEVPIALGGPFIGSYRAAEPSRVLRMEASDYYALAARWPAIAESVGALARERIGGLQGLAAEAPKAKATILGHRHDVACHDLRRFLARNQLSFDWITPEDAKLHERWPNPCPSDDALPALMLADGTMLMRPEPRQVAMRLGLQTRGRLDEYDTIIVGAGPAGLAAAVYGASEGLRTLVVEREAPGGQAGTSSRIENYLGFPNGVSGDELAMRALQQARRLGAEILVTRNIGCIDAEGHRVMLDDGESLRAHTIILATGVAWRRLAIDGFDRFIGKGIYYGAARSEASNTQGAEVCLIGGGNSAGQAALFFASYAHSVTLLVRGDALEKSMSHYLVEQVRAKSNISVLLGSEVTAVQGGDSLASIDVVERSSGVVSRRPCGALFIFIGADAQTEWLPTGIARDARGYVLTGADLVNHGRWSHTRDPYLLETSVPGIFACGDVRASPVKRVASAVGEGSMAVAFVHQYLQHDAAARQAAARA